MKILKHVILVAAAASLTGYSLLGNQSVATSKAYTPQLHYDTCPDQSLNIGSTGGLTQITLAGEEVPLQSRWVRSRVSREIADRLQNPKALNNLMAHSRHMYKQVQPILKKHGIPRDFRYVMVVESMGKQSAVSHRGATGLWQLMAAPARDLGLQVNDSVDERVNVIKATNAACRFIKQLYRETGSWTNALAAYNVGVNRFMRKCEQAGHGNYYKLKLNQETNRYIYKIIALKELTERPEAYGLKPSHIPQPTLLASNRRVKPAKRVPTLAQNIKYRTHYIAQVKPRNAWIVSRPLALNYGQELAMRMPPASKALRLLTEPSARPRQELLVAMGMPTMLRY